jgi:hypothetical protein
LNNNKIKPNITISSFKSISVLFFFIIIFVAIIFIVIDCTNFNNELMKKNILSTNTIESNKSNNSFNIPFCTFVVPYSQFKLISELIVPNDSQSFFPDVTSSRYINIQVPFDEPIIRRVIYCLEYSLYKHSVYKGCQYPFFKFVIPNKLLIKITKRYPAVKYYEPSDSSVYQTIIEIPFDEQSLQILRFIEIERGLITNTLIET